MNTLSRLRKALRIEVKHELGKRSELGVRELDVDMAADDVFVRIEGCIENVAAL